jgi:hypothetical protein
MNDRPTTYREDVVNVGWCLIALGVLICGIAWLLG